VDSSSDEEEWWNGVYSAPMGEEADKEEEMLDACKDNDIDRVLSLIGDDLQKSQVNLDARIPLGFPNPPRFSRKRRSVVFEPGFFQAVCERGHEELVKYFIQREECRFDTTDMVSEKVGRSSAPLYPFSLFLHIGFSTLVSPHWLLSLTLLYGLLYSPNFRTSSRPSTLRSSPTTSPSSSSW